MSDRDNSTALQERLARLEDEVERLRLQVGALRQRDVLARGHGTTAATGDGRAMHLVVARDEWGSAVTEDVAAVCSSCAETILQAIEPKSEQPTTLVLMWDENGPKRLWRPGPNGEHVILLSARDRHWAQYAYQFSHEMGHVLCGSRDGSAAQAWFEEAFCTALSIWVLERMSVSWRTNPPYSNWSDYATALAEYARDIRRRAHEPPALPAWYATNRDHLSLEAHDRPKNLIVARHLADTANTNTDFFQAFCHLRDTGGAVDASLEQLLGDWLASCPAHLQFAPLSVAQLLGVTPGLARWR